MKKKIFTICLCVAMLAIALVGGTLAYFTDVDEEKNTFTIGSVKIDLIESQYHRVNAGKGYTTEEEPLQGGYLWASNVELLGTPENTPDYDNYKESYNGTYFSDEQIQEDAKTYKNEGGYFATESKDMVPGDNVRKNPYVINTGKNPAYIRVRALVPVSLFKVLDNGSSYWTSTALNAGVTSKAVDYYRANGLDQFILTYPQVYRDGVNYYEIDFTYPKPLEPNEMTFWNVWGNIAIDPDATADDLKDIESFNVIFEADAIQSEGFANAEAAFKAFDDKTNE